MWKKITPKTKILAVFLNDNNVPVLPTISIFCFIYLFFCVCVFTSLSLVILLFCSPVVWLLKHQVEEESQHLLNLGIDMFGCVNDSHLVFHNSFRHCRNNNLSWSVTKTSTFHWTQHSQPESPRRDYFAVTAAVLHLPAEVIYWTDSKTFVNINHIHTHM